MHHSECVQLLRARGVAHVEVARGVAGVVLASVGCRFLGTHSHVRPVRYRMPDLRLSKDNCALNSIAVFGASRSSIT